MSDYVCSLGDDELVDAIKKNRFSQVQDILVQRSDSINLNRYIEENWCNRVSPLWIACRDTNRRIVTLLFAYGADPNFVAQELTQWTVLHYACNQAIYGLIKLLLEYKIIVNCQNRDGETPLYFLTSQRILDNHVRSCIQLLLEHKANVDIENDLGITALFYAVKWSWGECKSDIIQLFLKYDADVNKQLTKNYDNNVIGDTILHCAVQKNDIETIQLILECSSPNLLLRNSQNETACDLAIKLGHAPVTECLHMALLYQYHTFLKQNWLMTKKPLHRYKQFKVERIVI